MKIQNSIFVATCVTIGTLSAHAGFLSDVLQKEGVTNATVNALAPTADALTANATNQVAQTVATNAQATTALQSLLTQKTLSTNDFNALLNSLKPAGSTNSLSTSDLAQKLNGMFGNHFTVSNTNQWLQIINNYLSSHTNNSTASILSDIGNRYASTNAPTGTNTASPVINSALDWLKKK